MTVRAVNGKVRVEFDADEMNTVADAFLWACFYWNAEATEIEQGIGGRAPGQRAIARRYMDALDAIWGAFDKL